MKFFILILIISIFLQTSFVPVNLALILLLSRAYVVDEKMNLYLAFISGIMLGILSSQNIGFWPLIFLVVVKIVGLMRRLPISANFLTILPVSFLLIGLVDLAKSFILNQTFNWNLFLVEVIVTLPIYILVSFLEDRFVPKADIKLKIRN